MRHIKLLVIAIAAGIIINACNKSDLNKRPLGQLDEAAIANKKGVEKLLIGAYSLLDGVGGNKGGWFSAASNWIYGSICGSEAYKGSEEGDQGPEINPIEKFSMTANNASLASKWGTVYDGVQRANDVLRIMAKATDISADDQKRIAAEASFLRAHYHFEAKKMWSNIPFIDETITYVNGNYHVSNQTDAWPRIENDLLFAIANLKTTPYQDAVGRATKYTAIALLAKAYMFQKKFLQAKPLLDTIINSSPFHLVHYHDNFNPAKKNSHESIFSVQMSINEGFSIEPYTNGNSGDVLNFPFGGSPFSCCGFFQPSQYLVNHFKTDAITGLPDLDNFNDTDVKHDNGIPAADPFDPYTGTLDPRLDWTVGRRGIPYLDWGNHPGAAWIRDTAYGGPYSPKKNLYYQSQQGQQNDLSFWTNGSTTNNVNLIRFADVLLWAAEVEAELNNFTKARDYVNQVRRRAADTSGWVKKADGSFAANYKVGEYEDSWTDKVFALKAIRYERMLELAMEGHRFFDLVRWGIADIEINKYIEKEKNSRTHLVGAVFQKGRNEYFPIPQLQIDLSAGADGVSKMIQNPGY
jgi:starch-binding outer membrane protein, SusD/RagB family